MSAYKLIEVVKTSERENQSLYDKDNLQQAYADMHNDFGVAVKQETTLAVYCTVINQETGEKMDNLHWHYSSNKENEASVDTSIKQRVYTHNNYAEDNISAYDTEQLSIGNYHTKIAAQRNNSKCYKAITIRLDGIGDFADFDSWSKPIEQNS